MSITGRWFAVSTTLVASVLSCACGDGGLLGGGDGDRSDGDGLVDGGLRPSDECDPDPPINPDAEEIPDQFDNDCDGLVDEIVVCAGGDADHATIGEAIAAAPSGGVIAVCPGTYQERLVVDGKPLSIHGLEGAEATIIDAGGAGTAITVRDTADTGLRIEGFTIRGGRAAGGGGGVRCERSGLRLIDDLIRDNQAGGGGGGLYASGCDLEIAGTTFAGNDGAERGGGALLIDASGSLTGSRFEGNRATYGGALHVREGSLLLRDNQMRGNTAALRGGGLYHDSDAPVEGNLIAGNLAGWTGGGVHVVGHAPVLRDNVVRDNRSTNDGGGIYVHQGSTTILGGEVSGNTTEDDGGGIRLFESSGRVEGVLITGNVSGDGGGGIRVSHVAATFIDNTIRDNRAGMGGGIDMDNDSSTVRGGVIEGNSAWRGGGISMTLFPWHGGTIEGVRIAGNTAGYGGGIYMNDNFTAIALRDLDVVDNVANQGAGLFVRATNLTIRNTLVRGNQADDEGGGLYVGEPEPWGSPTECPCPPASPSVDVDFVVLSQNRAAAGGAVWTDTGGLSVGSSILTGNQAPAVVATGPEPAWSYNDTVPASFAGMANPTGSAGNISSDPAFADTTFRLAPGSPCVNAGDPALQDRDGSRADMGRYGGPEAP